MTASLKEPDSDSEDATGIGVFSASAIVTASMIGAGVYTTSGFTLSDLGSPHWVLLAWFVAGIVAICGAVCYGALAEHFTESGGEYLFLSRAVHPAAGMVAGWVSLLAGFTGAMAFAATTLETCIRSLTVGTFDPIPRGAIAISCIVAAAVIHSLGLKRGTGAQNILVGIKLLLIGVFLASAFALIGSWSVMEPVSSREISIESKTSWEFGLAFAGSLTWISLSYSGFNAAVYMTGEIRSPKRNVPRSMFWGTTAVMVIYLLLNAVFVYAPSVSAVAGEADVALVAVRALAGQIQDKGDTNSSWIVGLVGTVIVLGLVTSVSALTQSGPRVYRKMVEDGVLPRIVFGAGVVRAIWIQATLAVVVVSVTSVRQQLDYLGLTLSVCAALCGGILFFLPEHGFRSATVFRRFRFAIYPTVPIIYVVGTLTIATLTAVRAPFQALVVLATLMVGLVVYVATRFMERFVEDK